MRWNVSNISIIAHVIIGQLRIYKGLNIIPTCTGEPMYSFVIFTRVLWVHPLIRSIPIQMCHYYKK